IFFAQPEQRGAVKLGVAANVVICVGVQFLDILIKPGLFGVVMGVHVDDLGIPVRYLTRNTVATFENQDPLTGRGHVVGERSATRAGSNDDYVVTIVGHDANPPFAPQKMQRLLLSWCSLHHFTASLPLRQRYSSAAVSMSSGGA